MRIAQRVLTLSFLGLAACNRAGVGAQTLSREAARADLQALDSIVRTNSSYRLVNGYPFGAHLDSVGRALPTSVDIRDFWRSVQRAVGRLQDAHSNVRLPGGMSLPASAELPFALTTAGDTVVALDGCRCKLLVTSFPRAVAINGVPIDSLMRVAGIRFVGHSPQRFRLRALQSLAPIESVLRLAGSDRAGALEVRLAGTRGDTVIAMQSIPRGAARPPQADAELEMAGDVAVITIRGMSESADSIVKQAIESEPFRASRAVLIDVRGNNGGSRHVLRTLVPLLIDTPLVYNVAVPRGDMDDISVDSDYGLTTPADSNMPAAARAALRDALAAFKPSWDYRKEGFLPTVLGAVLTPAPSERRIRRKPVAVLIDEGCFSSCDIFAGAIRLAPGVTLIGTTTAGGSGRSRDFVLSNSRLRVTLSTMASFQPNGALYDGIGIRPTVVVERSIGDLAAGRDTQKEAALRLLRR
jgi:hypothetical protein